jgi:hypothetical protein
MADAGLFLRWGAPVRGRERKGFDFFAETLAYCQRLQDDGRIESMETVLLDAHGGDLRGFLLLRGERAALAALRVDDEFVSLVLRAGLILEGVGVIGAHLNEGVGWYLGFFQPHVEELT